MCTDIKKREKYTNFPIETSLWYVFYLNVIVIRTCGGPGGERRGRSHHFFTRLRETPTSLFNSYFICVFFSPGLCLRPPGDAGHVPPFEACNGDHSELCFGYMKECKICAPIHRPPPKNELPREIQHSSLTRTFICAGRRPGLQRFVITNVCIDVEYNIVYMEIR